MEFEHKGVPIFYTDTGKGSAVIFLHGFLENSNMWNTLSKEISKRNRVVCIDLLGHGKSGNLGYIHHMEDQAQMVASVLKYLKLRKYIVIGHSMGGYIALAFAELFPATVKGLCLLNSTSQADTNEKKKNRNRAIKAVKQGPRTFIRIAITNLFSVKNRIAHAKKIEKLTTEALQLSTRGIIASLEGMKLRKDRSKTLKKIQNSLLIIGKNDPVLNKNGLIKLAYATETKYTQLEGGHMSTIENRDELTPLLKDFVKSCN